MTKKILVLSSSFRKGGNSDTLCDQFVKGAVEAGHQVEKIFINDKKIGYCHGCGVCNTTHKCVLHDDMAEILDKMVQADVIVMATPVYFYSMNGQMKTLIDRTVPRYEEIAGKDFYFIVAAADSDRANMEKTLETFRGFTEDCLPDAHEKGVIYGTGAWQIGDIKSSPAMEEAYQAGRNAQVFLFILRPSPAGFPSGGQHLVRRPKLQQSSNLRVCSHQHK
uniref:flavodoxin family protein n=1 Tax=Candidatus Scatocola faecipullorum TaxID=2840917 RepID=UPI004026B4F2